MLVLASQNVNHVKTKDCESGSVRDIAFQSVLPYLLEHLFSAWNVNWWMLQNRCFSVKSVETKSAIWYNDRGENKMVDIVNIERSKKLKIYLLNLRLILSLWNVLRLFSFSSWCCAVEFTIRRVVIKRNKALLSGWRSAASKKKLAECRNVQWNC